MLPQKVGCAISRSRNSAGSAAERDPAMPLH
jgi:hypothetical protein